MREQFFQGISSAVSKQPNSKYFSEKRSANVNLTALQDYIHYMREKGVKVYPT